MGDFPQGGVHQTWPVFLRPVKIPYFSRIPYFTGTVRYGDRSLRYGNLRDGPKIYGYGNPRKIRDTGRNFFFKNTLHRTMNWLIGSDKVESGIKQSCGNEDRYSRSMKLNCMEGITWFNALDGEVYQSRGMASFYRTHRRTWRFENFIFAV